MFLEFGAPRHRNTEFRTLWVSACQQIKKKNNGDSIMNITKLSHVIINNRPSTGRRLPATVCRYNIVLSTTTKLDEMDKYDTI